MEESVKRTTARDEPETVGVQGSTEAEASSHQPRKRCRKAKVAKGSSDQTQEGSGNAEVVEGSSDQTKKRGPKAKLLPGEKKARKKERDHNRYENMKDGAQKYKEMGPQMEMLKNETADLRVEMREISSERLPSITENLTTVTKQLEIVNNHNKKNESLIHNLLQELSKDRKNMEIPWDEVYLEGQENRSMVLASPGHISNWKNLMTDSEYPSDIFDLVDGMSKQEILAEFKKIREHHEELERKHQELKRENEELKREHQELKRENGELKGEKDELSCRVTNIEISIYGRAMTPKK